MASGSQNYSAVAVIDRGTLAVRDCSLHEDLDAFARRDLDPDTLPLAATCSEAIVAALAVARRGNVDDADCLLRISADLAAAASLPRGSALALESQRLAAQAYVLYRRECFDLAEQAVHAAAAVDAMLIVDHGLSSMLAHVVQLGHNLVRVSFRRGDPEQGAVRVAAILGFLERHREPWPWPIEPALLGAWPLDQLCRTALADQIIAELASHLGATEPELRLRLLGVFRGALNETATACQSLGPAYRWLALAAVKEADPEEFLRSGTVWLHQCSTSWPLLGRVASAELALALAADGPDESFEHATTRSHSD